MKKSLLVLLAFLVVGALAFAAEPTAELKISEFTGNAAVTLGFDIDRGMAAFSNSTSVSLKIQLATGGTKDTTGEGIWGALQIKSSDVTSVNNTAAAPAFNAPALTVEKAQLNFGTIAYLGIKADGTTINYAGIPTQSQSVLKVDNTLRYGVLTANRVAAEIAVAPVAPSAPNGVVLGLTPAGIGNFTIDFRSVPAWNGGTTAATQLFFPNNWGARVKADITAVPNLTAQAGASYNFGVAGSTGQDIGVGGKVSYKVALGDPYFVQPTVAADVLLASTPNYMAFQASAGAVFGWGAASDFNTFFYQDTDGFTPGISVGIMYNEPDSTVADDENLGLNVSVYTGALVPNLTANAALEIKDLMVVAPAEMIMGANANVTYAIAMAPMTITPKFGFYFYSDPNQLTTEAQTDVYVKAAVEIAKIFPNTTLTFNYASNDFVGGVGNVAVDAETLGKFETTLKISF